MHGFRLRKNVRAEREGSQIPDILRAYRRAKMIPGLCATEEVVAGAEWSPGAYIPAKPLTQNEILEEAQALVRSKTSLIVKYAPQFQALRNALSAGRIAPRDFREYINGRASVGGQPGSIGHSFEIYYGQKELEKKDALGSGEVPVISSSGAENGCYGFFAFDWVIAPPMVTAPRTGSIGHAHVQEWPCGVTSDCLVLIPRSGVGLELLYVAAAVIRSERWRFDYSRKLTPQRIAEFPLPSTSDVLAGVRECIHSANQIEELVLEAAEDEYDAEIAEVRLAEIEASPRKVLHGAALEKRLKRWLA